MIAGVRRCLPQLLCGLAALALYARYDWLDPRRPALAAMDQGWWSFSDQGRYLASTLAWAAGVLDPAQHWYLPGYPLLAVPFLAATPANPYLIPDAACLLASVWLMAALAGEALPGQRWAPAAGALACLLTCAQPAVMEVWVTPWTTTPAAPLILGCVLALLRFMRQPGRARLALAAGGCAGCAAAIRPSDGALLLALTTVTGTLTLLAARPGWPAARRVAGAALLGAGIPIGLAATLYAMVHGFTLSPYLAYSAALGFEWRLLPLQWVTLVLDPQPMFPDGQGMITAFPAIPLGLAGLVACAVSPPFRERRLPHAFLLAVTAAYGALYLCYRDLHPPGLWRYYNYHYFKWLLPVLALYAALLLPALRRPQAALAAAALLAAILPWRAEAIVTPAALPQPAAGNRLDLPAGLGIGTALAVAASGGFDDIYNGTSDFYFGPARRWYPGAGSLATYPIPGGMMIAPLRPLAAGPGYAMLDPRIGLDPASAPRVLRLALQYGHPCYLPDWLSSGEGCRSDGPIPPPVLAPGRLPLDAASAPFLLRGWAGTEGDAARWTVGPAAALRMRLRPAPAAPLAITIEASAFVPPGSPALDVALDVNGMERARWQIGGGAPTALRTSLPAGAVGPDGLVQATLRIANPRSPAGTIGTSDTRLLGLRVQAVTLGQ